MTKRKGKSNKQPEDSLALLEPSVTQSRGIKDYTVPVAVFFIFVVAGSTAVWFCCQQQQTIDGLMETVNAMQLRVTKFQQQMGMGNAQVTSVAVFEERLYALEEAHAQAQKKAEVALAASEKIKSTDLQNQVWSVQSEMNAKLTELQQTTVSTVSLNALMKNKTEEFEKLKKKLNSVVSANSEVTVGISSLTDTVLVTTSRLDEQMSVVNGLASLLEQQRTELANLKESFVGNQKAVERNRQEVIDIKDLLEMEQARRSQALEDQLMSVRRSLKDHQRSTHSLHSHLAAQLEILQSQMLSQSQHHDSAEEEIGIKGQSEISVKGKEHKKEDNKAVSEEEANTRDVVGEQKEPTEDVEVPQTEDQQTQDVQLKSDDIIKENEEADEVQVNGEVENQDAIPEEPEVKDDGVENLQAKQEVSEDLVVSEEEQEAKKVKEEETVKDKNDIEVMDEDFAGEHAASEEDNAPGEDGAPEEVHEEIAEEQTEEALTKGSTLEETQSHMSENAKYVSEDDPVGEAKPEEPVKETEKQKDLEPIEYGIDGQEDEEPAEEFVEETTEQDISTSDV